MNRFAIATTPLSGVVVLTPRVYEDERGFFFEAWHRGEFEAAGLPTAFVQENQSGSAQGVIRGLHYQDRRAPIAKLVRCTVGSVYDVAVDLRADSPTFGQWFSVELSAANRRQIFIPEGFAHGLQALESGSEIQYKQTAFYAPGCEGIIRWDDPDLAIPWPLPPTALSAKDRSGGMSLAEYRSSPASFGSGS